MLWSGFKVSDPNITRRLQSTALQAERELRASLERQLRAYHALAEDLVHRLGLSDYLDALRHNDPTIPKGWNAEQWRQFFDAYLAEVGKVQGDGWGRANSSANELTARLRQLEGELARLQQERDALRAQVDSLQAQLQDALAKQVTDALKPKPVATKPDARQAKQPPSQDTKGGTELSPVYAEFVKRVKAVETPSRTALPIRMRNLLSAHGSKRVREVQALYAIAVLGLSIKAEIDWVLAAVHGLKPRSGSLRRLFDDIAEKGLIEQEILRIPSPQTRLAVVRLAEKGRYLVKTLFEQDPVETDWERLIRLHEGNRFPAHTAAVLLFTLHARLRGWSARAMPEVQNDTPPDAVVEREGERWFVEVELGKKDRGAKWQNNAALNGGKVALCAGTQKRRALLVGDCKRQGLHGVATDIETLISIPWHRISGATPLWTEEF